MNLIWHFCAKRIIQKPAIQVWKNVICQHSRLQSIKGFCLKARAVVADKLDVFPQKETDWCRQPRAPHQDNQDLPNELQFRKKFRPQKPKPFFHAPFPNKFWIPKPETHTPQLHPKIKIYSNWGNLLQCNLRPKTKQMNHYFDHIPHFLDQPFGLNFLSIYLLLLIPRAIRTN